MMLRWLRSLRQQQPVTVVELRRRLAALRQQQGQMTAARDALALDAMQSDEVAGRYQQLDGEAAELARQIQMLEAALPRAERQEADAAREADAAALAKREQDYQSQTADARAWLDDVLARLPSGVELTQARALRDALRDEARELSRWSRDAAIRRPFDPLDAIYAALVHRVQRVERSRWIHGDHPITLLDDKAS